MGGDDPLPVCFYHRNCLDGRSAAAVAKRHEGRLELRPVHHGAELQDPVLARRVYILDVALSEAAMRQVADEASEVVWLDHHASNQPLRDRLGWGHLDRHECGSTMAWRHCFPEDPLPEVLRYVRDKDLWRWELPDSRAICAGLDHTVDDTSLEGIFELDLAAMAELGRPILAAVAEAVSKTVARGVKVQDPYGLVGTTAMVVNSLEYINEVGERITGEEAAGGLGMDLAICFGLRRDGRWIHSLRSTGLDCGRIAENRGGGGHQRAASYVTERPFPLSDDCLYWPIP